MADEMKIEILADGTIRTETSPISPANHQSAEAFMNDFARLTGGEVSRNRKGHAHHHHHHSTKVEQK